MKRARTETDPGLLAELEALESEVQHVRKKRAHPRAPFATELLRRIADLAERAPALGVFSQLKVDRRKTLARLRAAKPARGSKDSRDGRAAMREPIFVEVPMGRAAAATSPVVITIDRGEGCLVTLEVRSEHQLADVVGVIGSLLGGRR